MSHLAENFVKLIREAVSVVHPREGNWKHLFEFLLHPLEASEQVTEVLLLERIRRFELYNHFDLVDCLDQLEQTEHAIWRGLEFGSRNRRYQQSRLGWSINTVVISHRLDDVGCGMQKARNGMVGSVLFGIEGRSQRVMCGVWVERVRPGAHPGIFQILLGCSFPGVVGIQGR